MANDKDFAKLIAGIIGAGIAEVAVSATVKGGKSSSDKDISDSKTQKTTE